VIEARKFGTICPQIIRDSVTVKIPGFDSSEPQSEDCLYLNIWTPGLDNRSRPVMLWIHGGAWTFGSGSQLTYQGYNLASRGDVVVITINYRLGVFGFLNLNEVTGGEIPSTGNEGLLDQIAALQWVRDNIAAFGGDPNNVTIFGESAGGISVGILMAMPQARKLFHKAILESGTGNMARPLAHCVGMSNLFLEVTGIKSSDIKEIRSLSTESLLAAQQEMTLRSPEVMVPVAPVIDGRILPRNPWEELMSGSAREISTLIGNNLEEQNLNIFRDPELRKIDETMLAKMLQSFVSAKDASHLIDVYKSERAKRGEPISPTEILSAIRTDLMFRVPAVRTAEAQCRYGQPAYHYIFTWKSPALDGALGACHALEMGFVFGTYDAVYCGSGPQVKKLSLRMQDGWIAFARYGNPSCQSLGEWPPYCDNRKTMILGRECYVENAPYEEERQVWDNISYVHPVG
jgi:para-nitrobenzyl esterase